MCEGTASVNRHSQVPDHQLESEQPAPSSKNMHANRTRYGTLSRRNPRRVPREKLSNGDARSLSVHARKKFAGSQPRIIIMTMYQNNDQERGR